MILYAITDTTLDALGEAIRSKTGGETLLNLSEMIAAINGIVVQTNDALDGLIDRTSEVVESNTVEAVADYAFFYNPSVRTVVLPQAKTIGTYAFCDCGNLERISSGAVKIGAYAFYGCDELNEILFDDSLTEIGVAAFDGCSSLESINLRNTSVATLLPSSFAASGLRELWLPENRYCALPNVNTFAGTPIGTDGEGGVIHVPMQYRVRYESNSVWARILGNGTNRVVTYN